MNHGSIFGTVPDWLGAISSIAIFVASLIFSRKANSIAKSSDDTQRAMLELDAKIENSKRPLVHVWFNSHAIPDGKTIGSFTMINIGGTSLPIRSLRILFGPKTQGNAAAIGAYTIHENKRHKIGVRHSDHLIADIILHPGQLYFVEVVLHGHQMRFEVMYYDNTYEFVEIDISNLGGKYLLTGNGKK